MTRCIINDRLEAMRDGVCVAVAALVLAGCGGPKKTLHCDSEQECIQRSAEKCGGENKFKLWSQNSKGAPKWWRLESRETFVIECMPDPTSNTYSSEMVPRRSSSG